MSTLPPTSPQEPTYRPAQPASAAPYGAQYSPHAQQTQHAQQTPQPAAAKSGGWGKRILLWIFLGLFVGSVVLNLLLLILLAGTLGIDEGMDQVVIEEGSASQTVAVFNIDGAIGDQTVDDFRRFHKIVAKDNSIKAVVLRVDSPGGTVSASDQIYHMMLDIRDNQKKPVLVSMGGVAASGGYYVAAPANKIYAEPTTITGSIGVISVWPVLKGLLDRNGIEVVTIRSRQAMGNKANENFWETPEGRTRKEVQDMLSTMHARFEQVVRQGRPQIFTQKVQVKARVVGDNGQVQEQTFEEIEPLNGKVYLAEEAKNKWKLVDEIGYLADTTREAARMARLDKPRVVQYKRHVGLFGLADAQGSPPPSISAETLDKLTAPRILMMWKVD